jgi:GDP-L-fucose synthase
MILGKKILVTGGYGFLGHMVNQAFVERGFRIVTDESAFEKDSIFIFNSKQYDLVNQQATFDLIERLKPDIIVHLAARVGGIGINQKKPGSFFYSNVMMGVNIIEAARLFDVSKVVTVGTICAYPKFASIPFQEDDLWSGYPEETNAPYGLAKKALLVQSQAYRNEFGLNAIYLLPVNLYGPRDNFDLETSHVIPAMIRKFIDARDRGANSVTLWGTGAASREFLYVKDAAEGIVLATENYDGVDPVNLGSGMEITIKDLAEKLATHTGFRGEIKWDHGKPDGQPRRCLNVDRAKAFGFTAKTSFDDGLKATISWYEALRRVE